MPSPRPAPTGDYRQHLEIETPEHVVIDYELAGVGSRIVAALADQLILVGLVVAFLLARAGLAWLGVEVTRWESAAIGLGLFVLWNGYYIFFEGLRAGQTPGKRLTGLRVVRDTGHPVDLTAAVLRNLLRIVDFIPPPYLLGTLLAALHPRAKRLGDLVAGTVVVRDRPMDRAAAEPVYSRAQSPLAAPELTDAEFSLLQQFVARGEALAPEARHRLAGGLASRLALPLAGIREHYVGREVDDTALLAALFAEETGRRRGTLAGRGAARGVADRLAARQQERWEAFDILARRAASGGLDRFSAGELPDFAARYREVTADLARLRTYRADPATVARVERLVAAGHNTLYRSERHPWRRLGRLVALEAPAAVVGARRYVLVAFLLFAVPAAVGFAMLRTRPQLAEELVPDVMLERAADAGGEIARGRHYAQLRAETRPVAASAIIANNVRVAFTCFAGGVLAGIGSLFFLAYNGLQLGLFAGHFANGGHLLYLLEFIMGHGVLELFAIWVAGAAGFLLGRAVLVPGELTRADALVLAGRTAVRLLVVTVLCLLVAGMIEGLVSTSGVGLALREGVSGGSALLLVGYLALGAAYRRQAARESGSGGGSGLP